MLDETIEACLAGNFPTNSALAAQHRAWLESQNADKEFCLGCSLVEYQILCALSAAVKPARVLEIGPGMGASSYAVLVGNPDASITQVDILGTRGTTLLTNELKQQVVSYQGTSKGFFQDNTQHFGMAFIDGDHMDPTVSEDIAGCIKWRTPGAVIVAHDIFHKDLDHIEKALSQQAAGAGMCYTAIKTGYHGLGIIY